MRTGAAPRAALGEHVSPALEPALRNWIRDTASLEPEEVRLMLIGFDLVVPDDYQMRYQEQMTAREARQAQLDETWDAARAAHAAKYGSEGGVSVPFMEHRPIVPAPVHPYAEFLARGTSTEILWDLVDGLLYRLCSEPDPAKPAWVNGLRRNGRQTKKIADSLNRLLVEARSVYEIAPDLRGLQRRIEATLAASLNGASGAADAAGYPAARLHLEKARGRLFGLHPDPSGAYDETVRAIEAVACPLFLPNAPKPTLGTVIAHLREAGPKYVYALTAQNGDVGNIGPVRDMMASVWKGHSDRHAGGPATVPVAREAAEAALTMAAALVTLLSRGAVRSGTP